MSLSQLVSFKSRFVTYLLNFARIYNHNWRNSSTIYVTRLASKEIFSPSNKIHRQVGRAKNLSAARYSSLPEAESTPAP